MWRHRIWILRPLDALNFIIVKKKRTIWFIYLLLLSILYFIISISICTICFGLPVLCWFLCTMISFHDPAWTRSIIMTLQWRCKPDFVRHKTWTLSRSSEFPFILKIQNLEHEDDDNDDDYNNNNKEEHQNNRNQTTKSCRQKQKTRKNTRWDAQRRWQQRTIELVQSRWQEIVPYFNRVPSLVIA